MGEEIREHKVVLEGRCKLSITGVISVRSFDEECIVLNLEGCRLTVEGRGLHIGELSLERGIVLTEGIVTALIYDEGGMKIRKKFFGFDREA